MAKKPVTFEKVGKAYIGMSTALSFEFGEVIIMAPDMEKLSTAFSLISGGVLDESLVKEGALIDASRISKEGKIKP